jgi:metal-responsive CopG/Arc/MetJ family transcriptional regulator
MDKTVGRGTFHNRSEAFRAIVEEHLREHPSLFLGDGVHYLIANAPNLSDDELEALGDTIFGESSITKLVTEDRDRG